MQTSTIDDNNDFGYGDGMETASQNAVRAWTLLFEFLEGERPRMIQTCQSVGVTLVELGVLKTLVTQGTQGMQELSYYHDKSTITRVVSRLVERGLVERRENPADRREKLVELTAEGTALANHILGILRTPPEALSSLSTTDQAHLVEVLEHILAARRS